jgi:hypothetical protein
MVQDGVVLLQSERLGDKVGVHGGQRPGQGEEAAV